MSGILIGAAHNLQKPKTVREYGVSWAGGTSTQLTRLGDAAGFADPSPAVGTGEGSSPFDSIMPWAGMKEYNVLQSQIAYEKGVDPEFSRTAYDVVISIPKFWYKIVTSGTEWQLWIANGPKDGYVEHPAFEGKDVIYYGKYATGSGYISRSGQSPLVNITRATFRTGARNKGAHWDMLNIAAYSAITMLYLVEYADWNSQAVIGQGYTNGSARVNTGGTNSMSYHTGRAAGTDGQTQIQYRGIEDMWGNVWQWCDGINFSGTQAYYCLTRANFGDDKSTGYTKLGYQLMVLVLKDTLTRGMYAWTCAAIPGRGGSRAEKYIQRAIKNDPKGTKYILKLDVRKFYPSINHARLLAALERKVKDKKFLRMVSDILDTCGEGLAIGFYICQWLANFYLESFDRFVCTLDGVEHYVRYMDDCVLFGRNKKKLHKALRAMQDFLGRELLLEVKDNWQVFPLKARPLDFVGVKQYRKYRTIRKRTFLRFARQCRRAQKRRAAGKGIPPRMASALMSRAGLLKGVNCFGARKKYFEPIGEKYLKGVIRNESKRRQQAGYPVLLRANPQKAG